MNELVPAPSSSDVLRIMKCFWVVEKVAAASRDLNVTHK